MKNDFLNTQITAEFFSVVAQTANYCNDWILQQSFISSNNDALWGFYAFIFLVRVAYNWMFWSDLGGLFYNIFSDNVVYASLLSSKNLVTSLAHFSYGLQSQLLDLVVGNYDYTVISKRQSPILTINTWVVDILLTVLFWGFYFVLFFNLIFFTKTNVSGLLTAHNVTYSKFSYLVESEEELGSLDDALFFVSTFVILFSWFFLTSSFFAVVGVTSFSFLAVTFVLLSFFVLSIPFSVLLDFGLSFSAYVRGAGSSSNIFVEVIFDIIGVLIVFTRFVVQNIRFVLILWAYFELYEWFYLSPFTNLLNTLLDVHPSNFFNNFLTTQISLVHLTKLLFGILTYVYYFLHLLILLFIQLGAYFLISFWLFFFFYTSFFITKSEKLFFFKRYGTFN